MPVGPQHPGKMEFCLAGCSLYIESESIIWCYLLIVRMNRSGIQRVKSRRDFFHCIYKNPLAKFWLPTLAILISACLELLVPKEGKYFNQQHHNDSIELGHEVATWPFWIPMPLSQKARKGYYWLEWLILIAKEKLSCCYAIRVVRTMSGARRFSGASFDTFHMQ